MAIASKQWTERRIEDARKALSPRRLLWDGGSAGIDLSIVAFGYSRVSGNTVIVNSGRIRHGVRADIIVASTTVNILLDHTWIYVSHPYGESYGQILSAVSPPADSETTHNVLLHKWALTDGSASIEEIGHLGNIYIPGAFA